MNKSLTAKHIKQVYFQFLDELFPAECLVCQVEGDWFCAHCATKAIAIKSPTCPFCDKLSPLGKTCTSCKRNHTLTGARSFWYYTPTVKPLIHAFKYQGVKAATTTINPLLLNLVQELPLPRLGQIFITSVPRSPERVREFGYNQSEILAQSVAKAAGITYLPLLTRQQHTVSQTKLKRKDRLANTRQQFSLNNKISNISGSTIIIVDDVITTGATLSACSRLLKVAGAKQVWGITIAKD